MASVHIMYGTGLFSNLIWAKAFVRKLFFEQGLSQNSCYSIAQDDDGFMWFGTQDGLTV
jgi:hypothetical protein